MKRACTLRGAALLFVACIAPRGHAQTPATAAVDVSVASVGECQAQHERAKLLELQEKWLEAREAMIRCAVPSCPLAIRSDCAEWQEQLTRLLPTLLLVIERDDEVKGQVRVELDGKPIEVSEPPRPIEVLPGQHRLNFYLAGHSSLQQQLGLEKGEKNRVVRVRFTAETRVPAQAPPPPLTAPSSSPPPAPAPSRPVPTSTYVLASGALLAIGASTVLLVSALSSLDDARERCAPECSSDTRASIDRRLLLADIVGGVGIVLGSVAGYTFATRPIVSEGARAASAPGAKPGAGLAVSFQGQF